MNFNFILVSEGCLTDLVSSSVRLRNNYDYKYFDQKIIKDLTEDYSKKEGNKMINLVEKENIKKLKGKLFINGKPIEKFQSFEYKVSTTNQEFYLTIGKNKLEKNRKKKEKLLRRIQFLITEFNFELEEFIVGEKLPKIILSQMIDKFSSILKDCSECYQRSLYLNPEKDEAFKIGKLEILGIVDKLESELKRQPNMCIKCKEVFIRSNKDCMCGTCYNEVRPKPFLKDNGTD